MVFNGQPSKGCLECRTRKIRCGQERPHCSQCVRTHRSCSGYRDELDLVFRNETQSTRRRLKQEGNRRHAKRTDNQDHDSSSIHASDISSTEPSTPTKTDLSTTIDGKCMAPAVGLCRAITINSKDQAICFIMSNYAIPDPSSLRNTRSPLPLPKQKIANDVVTSCIAAVGMATLSNINGSPSHMLRARKEYGSSLTLVNTCLRDPFLMKDNATVTAVMLLSMFEVVTCEASQSIQTWKRHLEGATALLIMRGPIRLDGLISFRIFVQLRHQILSGCLLTNSRAHPSLVEHWAMEGDGRLRFWYGVEKHLSTLIAELCNLRADICERVITDSDAILSALLDLEAKFISWRMIFKQKSPYTTIKTSKNGHIPQKTFRDEYHVYQAGWDVVTWNGYRSTHMVLSLTILEQFEAISQFPTTSPHTLHAWRDCVKNSMHTCGELAWDICASAPFQLGFIQNDDGGPPFPGRILGGYLMLWPLYLAGNVSRTNFAVKDWAAECLEYIGHEMGIHKALRMAEMLRGGYYIGEWSS